MINFNYINNINFTSKCVKDDVPILENNGQNKYGPSNRRLVEFDIYKDKEKIESICKTDEFSSFGSDLVKDLYEDDYWSGVEKKHCYALVDNTEDNLADIDKDKVLGIYTLYETNNKDVPLSIPYFMTNGKYENEFKPSDIKYKNIGKGMFKSIPYMYPDKSIFTYVAYSAMGFWERMGFKHLSERRLVYVPESQKDKINLNLYG